jgi:phenylacetate-CoA ligase
MLERISKSVRYFFERTMVFDASRVSSETTPVIVEKIHNFQPRFVRGYPSAIYLLARFLEKSGQYMIKPRAIFTGAEVLYDYQRELFRKVFECEAYSHYCSFEAHPIAVECPTHSGHHITAENVIIEIVNDEGKSVPAGEEGRIVITNLHNYAMPFIRYDIGDMGALSGQACSCGRGLPLLTSLSGRADDIIVTRNGRYIPGTVLQRMFLAFLAVEQCQIVQESYENVTVKLAVHESSTQEDMDKITSEVLKVYKPLLGEDIDVTVEFVDCIPLTRAGKQRVVISKLDQCI